MTWVSGPMLTQEDILGYPEPGAVLGGLPAVQPMASRGTCPSCGREFSLTKGGKVRRHGHRLVKGGAQKVCEGSGEPPVR